MSSQPIVGRPARPVRDFTLADGFREAEHQFWELFVRPSRALLPTPEMKLDLSEDDKAYQIKADVPGVKKEDIKVKIDGKVVSIGAEVRKDEEAKIGRKVISSERASSQYRVFSLAQEIDAEKAEAKYQDGVLELTLPKKPGAKVTEVQVK